MLMTAGPGTNLLVHSAILLELRNQNPHRPSWPTMDSVGRCTSDHLICMKVQHAWRSAPFDNAKGPSCDLETILNDRHKFRLVGDFRNCLARRRIDLLQSLRS